MADKEGASGNATIDISKIEKGVKEPGIATDLDKLDFGDTVDEPVVEDEPAKKPGKKEKAKEKEAESAETTETEEEETNEVDADEEDDDAEEEGHEEEVKGKGKEKQAEPAKKEVKMVPQARMMHVKNQRDVLTDQLARANEQIELLKQSSTNSKAAEQYEEKISNLYIELEKERAAGNVESSARLARQLDKLKDDASKRQSQMISQVETRNLLEQRVYDATVKQLETADPRVDPDHDDFDQDLVRDLDSMTRGYESQGVLPSDALRRAAERLLGKDVFADKSIRRDKQPEPKKTDTKKNAEAAKKIPPSAVKEERTEKEQSLKPTTMTRDEFNKLPEATQRRLLGDDV